MEGLVEKQIELFMKKKEDSDPTCLVNILLSSDVYKNDINKISNDMIIGMFAATDTSRNTTIISMCHLIKNAVS